jgi:hypothetical protein
VGASTALNGFLIATAGGFASAAIATGSLKAGLWGAVSAAAFFGIGRGKDFGTALKRAAASAAVGGTASKLSGGSFANGATTGAFQQLFNSFAHDELAAWAKHSQSKHEGFGPVGTGSGGNNNQAIDVSNAVKTLDANAVPASTGFCARHVRLALEAGGANTESINDPNAYTLYAKDYGPVLLREGFTLLDISNGFTAQAGDVAVFSSYVGQDPPAGHIQMYNGSSWVSDFTQNNFSPFRTQPNVSYEIYRP